MWHPLAVILIATIGCTSIDGAGVYKNYIAYYPGTLPVVIGAPHGGRVKPNEVPNRDAGCWDGSRCIWTHGCGNKNTRKCRARTSADLYTKELAIRLRDELYQLFGEYPHLIACELHRSKMDANREIGEATFGVASMEAAWTQFHTFINQSKAASLPQPSLYLDIHGHAHALQRAELGYLLSGSQLDRNNIPASMTSIRRLAGSVRTSFEELLRGRQSFGGILESEGFAAVPSASKPGPRGNPYYRGGDNIRMHGSRSGGSTDAIQIESPTSFRSSQWRPRYAQALAKTVQRYLAQYYGFTGQIKQ